MDYTAEWVQWLVDVLRDNITDESEQTVRVEGNRVVADDSSHEAEYVFTVTRRERNTLAA
jgi:hypothetical protein